MTQAAVQPGRPAAATQPKAVPPLVLASLLAALLAAFSLIPWVRENLRLASSIWTASVAILTLAAFVRQRAASAGRVLSYRFSPKPVHYVQLTMHASIYVYWGYYWREVYHYAPLILAQIVFLYALDMLVCWSRRDQWILGFGPFPIVFSTNLFLWFRDDYFYLQFLMIATAVLCKEFLTWQRDGRRTHIFNPSAIALAIFSLALLATGATNISWAESVSISLGRPPYIYLWIFATGIVVQSLFRVTLVTLSAAASLILLNLTYTAVTGSYYFVDSAIPIAVFLGLHLLVTDPATSPRSNFGKALFGALYGLAVFTLYAVLGRLGMPTFYDKLLAVPPLNLLVPILERAGLALEARFHRLPSWTPARLNIAHMAVWITLFFVIRGTGLIGADHPGRNPDFWRRACEEGRTRACPTWTRMETVACVHASGAACLQLAYAQDEGTALPRDPEQAAKNYARACDLKAPGACASLIAMTRKLGPAVLQRPCSAGDSESCFFLASLYHANKDYLHAANLFRQSCEANWPRACGGLAELYKAGQGTPPDLAQATRYFEQACTNGIAASCNSVAALYRESNNPTLAAARQTQACALSTRAAIDDAAFFRATAAVAPPPAFCPQ